MKKPESKLIHLLKKGEFRVYCRPSSAPDNLDITMYPSKATCSNCLTKMRMTTMNRKSQFRVSHIGRELGADPFGRWKGGYGA